MELKKLITFLKKYRIRLFLLSLLFGLMGVGLYYLLPQRYIATGAFYVTRLVEPVSEDFSYEGYYSQQTATSYARTLMGLLESVDMRSKALRELGFNVDEYNLRSYKRSMKVKDAGPQLIVLEVKGKTAGEAKDFWEALVAVTLETSSSLNMFGDPGLRAVVINDSLVVKESYRNVFVNFAVGAGFGALVGVLGISLKEYLS